jgi:hypothetical protein
MERAAMDMFLSLDKYPALCKPKSLGALYHPDEAVFPFGSQILQMCHTHFK